jgi:uncharacterized protein (DUF885 family)
MTHSRIVVLVIAVAGLFACGRPAPPKPAPAPAPRPDAAAQLRTLVDRYYDDYLELNPTSATVLGDHRYDARLPNSIASEHLAKAKAIEEKYLEAAQKLDRATFTDNAVMTYEAFVYERQAKIDAMHFPQHLIPLSQWNSVATQFAQLGSGTTAQPFATVRDYENFLARIDGFVIWMDQAIANMKDGVAAGVVQPKVLMERALPQLKSQIVSDPTTSTFYQPVAKLPAAFSPADRERLTAAYTAAIRDRLVPAYTRVYDFIRRDYLPKTRATVGLSQLPEGAKWYATLVRAHTTTDLSPEEIHAIGLKECDRIRGEIETLMRETGFQGDFAAMIRFLRHDPRFYFGKPNELLDAYRALQQRVDSAMPKLFSERPRAALEIRPVEEFRAVSEATAEYIGPPADGSRPGLFYVNTYDLRSRPKYEMESIFLHEAIPGHHFQTSIALENTSLPKIQRFSPESYFAVDVDTSTAFVEGWGLYSESLGAELGLYTDPYQKLGALLNESWRAARLVIDTGLHAKGWTREQAIGFLRDHTGSGESDLAAEVERYIADPGQALAYKIGELTLRRLRNEATAALGAKFEVREFHRTVLDNGVLPLHVLEEHVHQWMRAKAGTATPPAQ